MSDGSLAAKYRDLEQAFQALFHKSPIGIAYHRIIVDDQDRPVDYFFLDANENYRELTGVDPRGKLVTEAFPGIEKDPFDWIGTFGKVAQTGESIRFQQYLEPVDRWYDAVGYQSSPGHFVAAFVEITEMKRKEAELERYKDRLEELVEERTKELAEEKEKAEAANRAKTVFLANMSHELRTPLNAVIGYADILASRETDPTNERYLNSIRSSGNSLLTLINDVLDLSRIEQGKAAIELQPISPRNLFDEMESLFSGRALSKDLKLRFEVTDAVPEFVESDPIRLRQILVNLLGNSIKFTEEGSVRARWDAVPGEAGSVSLRLEIADTGKGIEVTDQERIFDSFVQAANQRPSDYEGAGLGLTITANIVDQLSGTIELESEPGEGTRFTVTLPNLTIPEEPAEKPARLDLAALRFGQCTVFVVDDVEYNRDLLSAYLTGHGATPVLFDRAEPAVDAAAEQRPQLILMDLRLPGMDGLEATKQIKANPETSQIPVVVVTASAQPEDEGEVRRHADGFIRKPVVRQTLFPELMKYLPFHLGDRVGDAQPVGAGTAAGAADLAATGGGGGDDSGRSALLELQEVILDGDLHRFRELLSQHRGAGRIDAAILEELDGLATSYMDEQIISYLRELLGE